VEPHARGDAGDAAGEIAEDLGELRARHELVERDVPAADEEARAGGGPVVALVDVQALQAEREDGDEGRQEAEQRAMNVSRSIGLVSSRNDMRWRSSAERSVARDSWSKMAFSAGLSGRSRPLTIA
jgi:hypothetical protein